MLRTTICLLWKALNCLSVVFVLFTYLPCLRGAEESSQPNVLFIAVDDLNDWVGVLGGHPQARTPHVDRLAQRGLLFRQAYCSAPGCNASRSSLLTGLRPSTTGVYANAHDWRKAKTLAGAVTLPRHFRANGYLTLGSGKLFHAHTFFDKKHLSGYSEPEAWHDYYPSKARQMPEEVVPESWPVNSSREFYKGHFDWAPLEIPEEEMADAQVVRWAKQQLSKRHEAPVFLSVGIYRPHVPWYVPQQYYDMFPLEEVELPAYLEEDLADVPVKGQKMARRKWHQWIVENDQWQRAVQGYLASLAFADAMVGQLVDALDAGPWPENTIIVLWGDHGYHLGEKESWEKFALWEDTTHVPLIVIAPGLTRAEDVCDSPVSLLDLYPTLLELCNLDLPPQQLEGVSLVPRLGSAAASTKGFALSTQGKGNHAVRTDRFRYIRYADGEEELYDHASDLHEWRNLAEQPELQVIKSSLADYLPSRDAEPAVVKKPEKRVVSEMAPCRESETCPAPVQASCSPVKRQRCCVRHVSKHRGIRLRKCRLASGN